MRLIVFAFALLAIPALASAREVSVSWDAVTGAIEYQVLASQNGDPYAITATTSETTATFEGDTNESLVVRVCALGDAPSPRCSEPTAVHFVPPGEAPQAPTNVRLELQGTMTFE